MSRWAVRKGYRSTPFIGDDSDVIRRRKEAQRHRRLEPGEEEHLLQAAGPHVQALIIAAVETCCPKGSCSNSTGAMFRLHEVRLSSVQNTRRTARNESFQSPVAYGNYWRCDAIVPTAHRSRRRLTFSATKSAAASAASNALGKPLSFERTVTSRCGYGRESSAQTTRAQRS